MNIKFLIGAVAGALMLGALAVPAFAAGGFDQYGYNNTARIFNGTGSSWCQGKFGLNKATCDASLGAYANDKLVMKWNAAWDACNAAGTNSAADCLGAWTDNEWNGLVPGGSGETAHYKIVWVGGDCGADYTPLADGGLCIWGSYEMLMLQGTYSGGHYIVKAVPNGYGVVRP